MLRRLAHAQEVPRPRLVGAANKSHPKVASKSALEEVLDFAGGDTREIADHHQHQMGHFCMSLQSPSHVVPVIMQVINGPGFAKLCMCNAMFNGMFNAILNAICNPF